MPARTGPGLSSADEQTLVGDDVERPDAPRAFARGDAIGRYLLLDPLGQGAMGRVFRAYDPDLDRQVALKILFEHVEHGPEHRDRLLGEAKAMARIGHPNVVAVHDAGMHAGSVFIAMELVDGASLDRWLETPRDPDEILDVLLAAARGLAAAHEAGVVHRDFKPANILVSKDGHAKVGDFGLAGIEDPTRVGLAETKKGSAMGTPAYMSPEHFAGIGIDARSDQFSFAITLFEALHGERPYSATTLVALAGQVLTGELTPTLVTRSRGVDGIIRRALSVKPEARFATMTGLITALERARRPVWRRWAGLAGVVVAGSLLVLSQGTETRGEACTSGAERVGSFWGPHAKTALRVGGSDYSESFARATRERLEAALDDYATRWIAAHDQSCTAVGLRRGEGSSAEQVTAQCLENRLDSLRGLAELATAEPLDAGRIDALVATLPVLEDCGSSRWIPYPAEPDRAARAAALHRRISKLDRAYTADQPQGLAEEALAAVGDARELGEPYLLALALGRRARVLDVEQAAPLLDEALGIAIAGGFELLAAELVNDLLLTSSPRKNAKSWRTTGHLVTVARGFIAHGGGDEILLGNLALNEANILRRAGRFEQAVVRDSEAEEHFSRAGSSLGVAKARFNQVITLLRQRRLDEALSRLTTATAELERESGVTSPLAFQGQMTVLASLIYAGRNHEAFTMAQAAHRSAQQLYTPESSTLWEATMALAITASNIGQAELAHELIVELRKLPTPLVYAATDLDFLELEWLASQGRHEEALRMVPLVRERLDATDTAGLASLELSVAKNVFVLGRGAEIPALLRSPLFSASVDDPQQREDIATATALLAVLTRAPAPPGTTWLARAPAEPATVLNQRLREVIDAIEHEPDPAPTVRRVRDEIAEMYQPRELYVLMLDTWLAEHVSP